MRIKIFLRTLLILAVICFCLFGMAACNKSVSTEYDVIKQTKRDNFNLLNETAMHGQTVLIGDSIIELFPEEIYYGSPTVAYNRGISGDTSDKMLERLEENALSIRPSEILILVGTNDLSRGIDADVIVGNIASAVDKCIAGSVGKITVSSLLPVNRSVNSQMVGSRKNADIIAINEKLSRLCEEKHVIYADMFSVLTDTDGNFNAEYTYDGLHPNAKGYAVMASVLLLA